MMKKIFQLIFLGISSVAFSQSTGDITFSYTVDYNSASNMREVTVFATSSTGTQTMTGFGFVFYYNSLESDYVSVDYTGLTNLGWTIGSNTTVTETVEMNGAVPITHDTKVEIAPLDEDLSGSIIPNTATELMKVFFNNDVGTPAASDAYAGASGNLNGPVTNPSIVYTDELFNSFFINVLGSRQQSLPIIIKSFTASPYDNESAILNWETLSEINGSHFEIERSDDVENWEYIGTVEAVGESTTTQSYRYIDWGVFGLRTESTMYYRLKLVDKDGTYEYSEIRSVTKNIEGIRVSMYPNPVSDVLKVEIVSENSEAGTPVFAEILDVSGKILKKNQISLNGISEIRVNELPSGLKIVKVSYDGKDFFESIIKID